MTSKSDGIVQVLKDAPPGQRLCLAGVWVCALVAGILSIWEGDWLHVAVFLGMIWQQTWLVSATQRGSSLSGRENIGIGVLTIMIIILVIMILMQRLFP